jgi:hypothetical protein
VTTNCLPGWMILLAKLLERIVETAIKALVESGSLIKTGASSGRVFAKTLAPPLIKRQQKTPQSIESRKRRQASDILNIIFLLSLLSKSSSPIRLRQGISAR